MSAPVAATAADGAISVTAVGGGEPGAGFAETLSRAAFEADILEAVRFDRARPTSTFAVAPPTAGEVLSQLERSAAARTDHPPALSTQDTPIPGAQAAVPVGEVGVAVSQGAAPVDEATEAVSQAAGSEMTRVTVEDSAPADNGPDKLNAAVPADGPSAGRTGQAAGQTAAGRVPQSSLGAKADAGDARGSEVTAIVEEAYREETRSAGDPAGARDECAVLAAEPQAKDTRRASGSRGAGTTDNGPTPADVAGRPAVLEDSGNRPGLGETARIGNQAREAAPGAFSLRDARALSETLLQESFKKLPRSVELRMDPPELGKVTVLLSQRGQDVTVKFLAGTGEGQRALSSALNDLERALSEKGLVLTGFSVDPGNRDQADREGRGDAGRPGTRKYPRVAEISAAAIGLTTKVGEGLFDRLA